MTTAPQPTPTQPTSFQVTASQPAPYSNVRTPAALQPALSLRGVSRVFGKNETQVTALHPTDFEVWPGELVAVIGPSGSGKSTLLTLAGALQTPSSGAVQLAGADLGQLAARQLADFRLRHIGFVLQASNLIPYLTVREQLTLVAHLAGRDQRAARAQADALLLKLGLAERAQHHPQQLSGGQKQRVAVARALMNDPALILADEPTAALDSARGREVVGLLAHEVAGGEKAAVLVTHDERVLDLCTRVVRLEDGRVVESSSSSPHSAPVGTDASAPA